MLHQSLLDLAAQAPLSETPATARGVLAESHELLRNALDHDEPEPQLSAWYSTLVVDTLRSPAAVELTGGVGLLPSGAVARGDALPSSTVTWLSTGDEAASAALAELVAAAGLPVSHTSLASCRARSGEAEALATLIDAGVSAPGVPPRVLLADAVASRPPTLRIQDGLPDRSMPVDVRAVLLLPVSDVARWAFPRAGSTLARIDAAVARDRLSPGEAEALRQAWETGVALQFRRWADRVHDRPVSLAELPVLHRTAYGAAARMVAGVLRSLAARHGLLLEGN